MTGDRLMYEALKPYAATPRQAQVIQALIETGSTRKAADREGIARGTVDGIVATVRRHAAKQGHAPDHDMTHPAPDGFYVKGTSTLYDQDGIAKAQWVKTSIDKERQDEMIRAAVAGMASELPKAEPTAAPDQTSASLMACYPIGDQHLGMLAWGEETGGEDYDLTIGEKLLMGAIDHLIQSAPKCDRAAIVALGDFMHYDSFESVTPASRHQLDADSRFPKMVRCAIRCLRYTITAALNRHAYVHVVIEIGNHDISSSIFLMECLKSIYENEPRVTVDNSPSHFHYFDFGKNLVGVHHGHGAKMGELPLIMATDRPEQWGNTEFRYWWTGHVHHDQVKDYAGCRVESFRILAPADAWAANKGYRAASDMKAIILHKDFGEVARHIVNPRMLNV
jgi:hypothetical protein